MPGTSCVSIVVAVIAGFVCFPESGRFKFLALVDNTMRLWVEQDKSKRAFEDPHKLSDRLVGPVDISAEAGV